MNELIAYVALAVFDGGDQSGSHIRTAVWAAAVLSLASGVLVAVRMYETHLRSDRGRSA